MNRLVLEILAAVLSSTQSHPHQPASVVELSSQDAGQFVLRSHHPAVDRLLVAEACEYQDKHDKSGHDKSTFDKTYDKAYNRDHHDKSYDKTYSKSS